MDHRPRDGHALLLASGQALGQAAPAPPEPDAIEEGARPRQPRVGDGPWSSRIGSSAFSSTVRRRDEVEELEHEADLPAADPREPGVVELIERGTALETSSMDPAVGRSSPDATRCRSVDFPDPLRPTSTAISPGAMAIETSRSTDPLGIPFAVGLADPLELNGGPNHARRLYRAAKRAHPSPRRPPPSEGPSPQKFLAKRSRFDRMLGANLRGDSLRGVPP